MLRCNACGGPTIKMYALLFWVAALIGLCGVYFRFGVCEGCLLWYLVKEPGFKVPLRYFWMFVRPRPFKFGRVRHTVVTCPEVPHVCALKSQGPPKKEKAAKRSQELSNSNSDSDLDSSSDGSCDGEPLALAPLVSGNWTVGASGGIPCSCIAPPFTCGYRHQNLFLWCVDCDGCIWCLKGGVHCLQV